MRKPPVRLGPRVSSRLLPSVRRALARPRLADTDHSESWIDAKALLLAAHSILLLTLLTEDICAESLTDQSASFGSWLESLGLGVESFLQQSLLEHTGLTASLVGLASLGVAVRLTGETGLEASHKGVAVGSALDTSHALLARLTHIELLLLWLLLSKGQALNSQLLEL